MPVEFSAKANLRGHCIDLVCAWQGRERPALCLVRRQRAFPSKLTDGLMIFKPDDFEQPSTQSLTRLERTATGLDAIIELETDENQGRITVQDRSLEPEVVYYYALFTLSATEGVQSGQVWQAAAMATGVYDWGRRLYDLLPAVYRRYDEPTPDRLGKGMLRLFLETVGLGLDHIRSLAEGLRGRHDVLNVQPDRLPLLARWIGWELDRTLDTLAQRRDILFAPETFRRVGTIPNLWALVNRVIGWDCRIKEFVHNVFLTNTPERLNLWLSESDDGSWSTPNQPLSLDDAYEGRPTAVDDGEGTLWLFYHAGGIRRRQTRATLETRYSWDIRYKTLVRKKGEQSANWSPSQPLTHGEDFDRHPTAALHGQDLWVFWDSYSKAEQRWRICYQIRSGGQWSTVIGTFIDSGQERRQPWAVADNQGGLWLFWLEKVGTAWQLYYSRHDGKGWASVQAFPAEEDLGDLFVLFHPTATARPLWVFWASQETIVQSQPRQPWSIQTRWRIAGRCKQSLDSGVSDWSEILPLPPVIDFDDREPAALLTTDGNIELFWSATRDGSWSIWRATLDIAKLSWGVPVLVTDNPYSQRAPLPVASDGRRLLFYRSNESLPWSSTEDAGCTTLDARYAGSTTVDSRNRAKLALRGLYEDFQTYSYDAGQNGRRTDQNWFASDTLGLYLTPTEEDPTLIVQGRNLAESFLKEFLPVQSRLVFIIPLITKEPALVITDQVDTYIHQHSPETYSGLTDSYRDKIPEWAWMRSWSPSDHIHFTVEFSITSKYTQFRTWYYAESEDSYPDKTSEWVRIYSWSPTYPDHFTVKLSVTPKYTQFRTPGMQDWKLEDNDL